MSQPSKRKNPASKQRARRDSARLLSDTGSRTATSAAAKPHKAKAKKRIKGTSSQAGRHSGRYSPETGLAGSSMLWTKEPAKAARHESPLPFRILRAIGSFIVLVFAALFKGIRVLVGSCASLIARSKAALTIVAILGILLIGGLFDTGWNWGKIYPGVHIGEIDLSGKTVEEAQKALEDTYSPRLSSKTVYIFANEEASKDLEASLETTNDEAMAEQLSLEDARAQKLVWETDAAALGAALDTKGLVAEALAFGREEGGLFARIQALFAGLTIKPRANYDEAALELLASDIDETIGKPRVNYGINVLEGNAIVVEGYDGVMVERQSFEDELDSALFGEDASRATFVAKVEHAPLQITWETAQQTCEQVNSAIALGARFLYQKASWTANAIDIGNWVRTRIEQRGDSWALVPYLDYDLAKGTLLNHLKPSFASGEASVRFTLEKGEVVVHSDNEGTIPHSRDAIQKLDAALFDTGDEISTQPSIEVDTASIPQTMSFQEALDSGIITRVSDFTTEYTANVVNRNHNIHLVADLLGKSIVPANGGIWSFNETAGNCNEESGFKGAGSIIDGEYVDEIGGGICQVATTVFNAAYEAGFPIVQRHNHSLYIASYPAGRDAAVSWPDLDLKWQNDSTSDILLLTSYTESTVSVALYGVSRDYTVSTATGNWVEGKKFETRTVVDENLAPDYSYVKTHGTNGSSITVIRTVKDVYGSIIYEDSFFSTYDPKDEVRIEGPKQKTGDSETVS